MLAFLLNKLFYRSPSFVADTEQILYFKDLWNEIQMSPDMPLTTEQLRYPKHQFLHYLSQHEDVVFHGSNHADIRQFEPRQQTLANGQRTKAIFASTDPIWPMFYAVLKRSKVQRNFRNGCLVYNNHRFHFYSLDQKTMQSYPWTTGMLYILPKKTFTMSGKGKIRFDEWVSPVSVKPISKIELDPKDFVFINKVSTHDPQESLAKTWLYYKKRTIGDTHKSSC